MIAKRSDDHLIITLAKEGKLGIRTTTRAAAESIML